MVMVKMDGCWASVLEHDHDNDNNNHNNTNNIIIAILAKICNNLMDTYNNHHSGHNNGKTSTIMMYHVNS